MQNDMFAAPIGTTTEYHPPPEKQDAREMSKEEANARAAAKIYELARVGRYGPNNREERRRVEKVLRTLNKRGLTVDLG